MAAVTEGLETLHFKEELIDGFNFLIEMIQMVGVKVVADIDTAKKLSRDLNFTDLMMRIIFELGRAANLLKSRVWRKSQYIVDLYKFEPMFQKLYTSYLGLLFASGMDMSVIKDTWSMKHQVNRFRLNSNY